MEHTLPRSANGTYTLPIAAFAPGGLIKSSDDNSNFSDIATALTQSLATTGVSTMTGQLNGAAGIVSSPGYAFNGASKTGFYLAGTNQIGVAVNGVQSATFNSDTSVTFDGNVTVNGILSASALPIGAMMDFAGSVAPSKWLLCFGQLVSATTYAALFAVIGTTYGSGAGTFGIPDCRGRATFGQDNMGGSAANRITSSLNYDGTVLGNAGGLQSHQLLAAEIPSITSTGSNTISVNSGAAYWANGSLTSFTGGGGNQTIANPTGPIAIASSGSNSITVTSQGTSGNSHTILSPSIITTKIIYAGA